MSVYYHCSRGHKGMPCVKVEPCQMAPEWGSGCLDTKMRLCGDCTWSGNLRKGKGRVWVTWAGIFCFKRPSAKWGHLLISFRLFPLCGRCFGPTCNPQPAPFALSFSVPEAVAQFAFAAKSGLVTHLAEVCLYIFGKTLTFLIKTNHWFSHIPPCPCFLS